MRKFRVKMNYGRFIVITPDNVAINERFKTIDGAMKYITTLITLAKMRVI